MDPVLNNDIPFPDGFRLDVRLLIEVLEARYLMLLYVGDIEEG
jgi:hypothetical protein